MRKYKSPPPNICQGTRGVCGIRGINQRIKKASDHKKNVYLFYGVGILSNSITYWTSGPSFQKKAFWKRYISGALMRGMRVKWQEKESSHLANFGRQLSDYWNATAFHAAFISSHISGCSQQGQKLSPVISITRYLSPWRRDEAAVWLFLCLLSLLLFSWLFSPLSPNILTSYFSLSVLTHHNLTCSFSLHKYTFPTSLIYILVYILPLYFSLANFSPSFLYLLSLPLPPCFLPLPLNLSSLLSLHSRAD